MAPADAHEERGIEADMCKHPRTPPLNRERDRETERDRERERDLVHNEGSRRGSVTGVDPKYSSLHLGRADNPHFILLKRFQDLRGADHPHFCVFIRFSRLGTPIASGQARSLSAHTSVRLDELTH